MKRKGNLYQKICSIETLEVADMIARKGKKHQYGIKMHDLNKQANILALHAALVNKIFTTSQYSTFKVYEPKEREVFRLPYYPDRIVHHSIHLVLEAIFVSMFTADTYSCIKGRGIHAASNAVKMALRDKAGTTFCLKLDVKKFYPSVDHDILIKLLKRKFKDADLIWLLENIIRSTAGLPIGSLTSQTFGNFYLTGFDHWIKEVKKIKYYFRYCDDIVILGSSKEVLHRLLIDIKHYLFENLKLQVKPNHQIFPVDSRGIDFCGYVHRHSHTLLRKSIKKRFARMMAKRRNKKSIASYWGWAKHADTKHLLKTLFSEKVQSIQHTSKDPKLYRRQDKDRTVIKPGNPSV
jgi:RNA-directed DNA polymerase